MENKRLCRPLSSRFCANLMSQASPPPAWQSFKMPHPLSGYCGPLAPAGAQAPPIAIQGWDHDQHEPDKMRHAGGQNGKQRTTPRRGTYKALRGQTASLEICPASAAYHLRTTLNRANYPILPLFGHFGMVRTK